MSEELEAFLSDETDAGIILSALAAGVLITLAVPWVQWILSLAFLLKPSWARTWGFPIGWLDMRLQGGLFLSAYPYAFILDVAFWSILALIILTLWREARGS
ncbi:MAG: hypothetical protein QXN33_00200 [Candidatus Bathyarchaeia archaeon]